jgi:glycosyltransferase involved in cell wall biosynthesis
MLRASVIVPARNALQTLARCLAALAAQRLEASEYEVIVVDDGSTDGTAALARSAFPAATVITQGPHGPAAARNRGAAAASAPVLAFCDADVFPTEGWLAAGLEAAGEADLVQGRVLPDPEAEVGPFDRTLWINSQVGLWETANLFVDRALFDRVGGFEAWLRPRTGKALAEDVWFGHRAVRAGARPAFCAEALAHHAVFHRGWRAYVGERRRLEYFPAMAAKMPELRETLLYRRLFLSDRSARVDLALAAVVTSAVAGRRWPLVAISPYAAALTTHARHRARTGSPTAIAAIAAADAAADLVGLAALSAGSARYRSPVV